MSAIRPDGNGKVVRLAARDDGTVSLPALVAAVAAGDEAAFRRLYDLRGPRMFGIALSITREPLLAADAVHDAFLELWRNATRFDERRGDPDVWLASLVRYRAVDITRRRRREVSDEDIPEPIDDEPDALARLEASSDSAALRECLDRLPEDRRQLLALAFMNGLSHSDLAKRFHVPMGTVKARVRRALQSLRICLEGEV